MISITSKTGSTDGVIFDESEDTKFKDISPRVTKTRTLDGGVVYDHRGVVTADRVFSIKALISESQSEAIRTIMENETYVNLSCKDGFFEGVISNAEGLDSGQLVMVFWVYVPIADVSGSTKRMYVHEDITVNESVTVTL